MQIMTRDLPKSIIEMIDTAVSNDFKIENLTEDDYNNEIYKMMKDSLEFSNIHILYERKVISNIHRAPIIPEVQYLFGFTPVDGLCILAKNKQHKEVLCNGQLFSIIRESTCLIHSIMYLLVNKKKFEVWSYLPMETDSGFNTCHSDTGIKLRTKLFAKD